MRDVSWCEKSNIQWKPSLAQLSRFVRHGRWHKVTADRHANISREWLEGETAVLCSECQQVIPHGAQFCFHCGRPANVSNKGSVETRLSARRSNSRIVQLVLAVVLLAIGIGIFLLRDGDVVSQLKQQISWSQERSITDSSFSVKPGGFSFYKFVVPSGALNATVRGELNSAAVPVRNSNGPANEDVEVYLLSDAAFVVWRNGYSAGAEYESGRITQGKVDVQLPAGAGVYYLVFSNRFSPQTAKLVHANLLLFYKSWLPEGLVSLKDRALSWLGL
jgi:uncharacterized OB-fold protein